MARQFGYVMLISMIYALFIIVGASNEQHQWTSLDGPYWANGIDVAVGDVY